MSRGRRWIACVLLPGVLVTGPLAYADDARWSLELKGGLFEPDLDDYGTYYGGDDDAYFAVTATWLALRWLEVGAEVGYFDDDGVGVLPVSGLPGAPVQYTLWPAHLFVTAVGEFSADQLLVPYAGVGATVAYYEQNVEQQPDRSGRTDVGANARIGLRLLLDRVDPVTASESSFLQRTYLFVEGQWFTTEVDDVDLGGTTLTIGFKLEF